jgi:hypothetical protein
VNRLLLAAGAAVAIHLVLKSVRQNPPKIIVVDRLPANFNAVTVPPFGIFILRGQESNAALLKHEMVHWNQFQQLGLLPYYYELHG